MIDYNMCDCCEDNYPTDELIWIDSEDFEPKDDDDFNLEKCKSSIEVLGYSALCELCYKVNCCGKNEN